MKRAFRLLAAVIGGLTVLLADAAAKDEKFKPEELVAKHLAAIGSAEARSRIKSRTVAGTTTFVLRLGGHGEGSGSANVLSDERRTRIGLKFTSLQVPGEQLAFDGKGVSVGLVRPGQRSPLSQFVHHYEVMMRDGLLGGVLSAAWGLLDVPGRQPRLTSTGIKKIEGRRLHELKYQDRGGTTDLQISLYFDPETFRHVLTQYRLVQPSGMPSVPGETPPRDTFHTVREYFDDFKEVDGLTLPHSYKLVYTIEGLNTTYIGQWSISDIKIAHNTPMEDGYFSIK